MKKNTQHKPVSAGIEIKQSVSIPSTPEDHVLTWLKPIVRHCGNPLRAPWHVERRRIRDYLLHAVRDGKGIFTLDGIDYQVGPGDLFWIPPDVEHELRGFSESMSCPYIHFDLIYRPGKSDYIIEAQGKVHELPEYRALMHPPLPEANPFRDLKGPIRTPLNDRIIELMIGVCNEAVRSQPYARLKTTGLMFEILSDIIRGVQGVPESYMEHLPLLEKAVGHIYNNLTKTLQLENIAAFCNISVNELRNLFHRHYQCSPRTFIRQVRINKAKEMLVEDEEMNITEVAYAVGFGSIYSFTRAFTEVEGIPPTAFRRFGAAHLASETRGQLHMPMDGIESHSRTKHRLRHPPQK